MPQIVERRVHEHVNWRESLERRECGLMFTALESIASDPNCVGCTLILLRTPLQHLGRTNKIPAQRVDGHTPSIDLRGRSIAAAAVSRSWAARARSALSKCCLKDHDVRRRGLARRRRQRVFARSPSSVREWPLRLRWPLRMIRPADPPAHRAHRRKHRGRRGPGRRRLLRPRIAAARRACDGLHGNLECCGQTQQSRIGGRDGQRSLEILCTRLEVAGCKSRLRLSAEPLDVPPPFSGGVGGRPRAGNGLGELGQSRRRDRAVDGICLRQQLRGRFHVSAVERAESAVDDRIQTLSCCDDPFEPLVLDALIPRLDGGRASSRMDSASALPASWASASVAARNADSKGLPVGCSERAGARGRRDGPVRDLLHLMPPLAEAPLKSESRGVSIPNGSELHPARSQRPQIAIIEQAPGVGEALDNERASFPRCASRMTASILESSGSCSSASWHSSRAASNSPRSRRVFARASS